GSFRTLPTTPASCSASIAAVLRLLLPFIGQPFGTTKRWVSREVTSMTSMLPSWSIRKGMAATCRTGSPFSALRNAFFLAAIVSSEWIVRAAPSESPAGSRLTIAKGRSPALSSGRGCRNFSGRCGYCRISVPGSRAALRGRGEAAAARERTACPPGGTAAGVAGTAAAAGGRPGRDGPRDAAGGGDRSQKGGRQGRRLLARGGDDGQWPARRCGRLGGKCC